jgi:hypothetical protein
MVTVATAVAVLGAPGIATPAGAEYAGNFRTAVRLDTSQVEAGPTCEVVDEWTCLLPGETAPGSLWLPHPDVLDADGTWHTGCEALPSVPDLDLGEVVVCSDGTTHHHDTDHTA